MYAEKDDPLKDQLNIDSDDENNKPNNLEKSVKFNKSEKDKIKEIATSSTYLNMAMNDIEKSQRKLEKIKKK